MGWDNANPFEYHPERGLYYHEVWPNLLCGTQPQTKEDIDVLASLLGPEGSILSLQQDKDLKYWGVRWHDLESQAQHHNLAYHRCPVCSSILMPMHLGIWH